jgi:hypothetical protein
MKSVEKNFITNILIVSMAFLFTSCYSEYLTMEYKVNSGAVWNDKQTKVAFVASSQAYRRPKGITTFPDGGKPKYLLRDVGLYVFNCENKSLDKLITFSDLYRELGFYSIGWDLKLVLTDSTILYLLAPILGWDRKIEGAFSPQNLQYRKSLKEKYGQPYAFNMHTKTSTTVDSTTFNNLLIKSEECDLAWLRQQLTTVPLANFGLKPKEIYPKSDREYIHETIYLRNGSTVTRRAVVEQIIATKPKAKIESILKKMDKYHNGFEEPYNSKYERQAKATYDQIKALL